VLRGALVYPHNRVDLARIRGRHRYASSYKGACRGVERLEVESLNASIGPNEFMEVGTESV
jgi:hypothetical protein